MKKFVIVILLILPIFLMLTISLAGQVLATLTYIYVESVSFVDDKQQDITDIKIGKGEQINLNDYVMVLPQLASNKTVEFKTQDTAVTISADGVLTGVEYDFATVIVTTIEGKKTDTLTVEVADDAVTGVDIACDSLELYLFEEIQMENAVEVYPSTALDKKVTWESSHPEYVEINENSGKIKAKKVTEEGMTVTITVTTRDGGFTDTCEIIVIPHLLAFMPQINDNATTYIHNEQTLDLMQFITYDTSKIVQDDISFTVQGDATIENNILKFNNENAIVKLVCKAVNENINVKINMFIKYERNS